MKREWTFLLLAVAFVFTSVWLPEVDGRDPGTSEEVWYVVSFSGTPVGIVKDQWRGGDEGVFYENYLEVTVSRLGTHMSMVARTEEQDDNDGVPVRFRHEMIVGETRMLTAGERQGDSLIVRSEGQGFANVKRIAWEDGAVGQGVLDEYVRERLENGDKEFTVRTFDLQFASFRTSRYLVTGEEDAVIQGEEGSYIILEQYEDDADHPNITSWLDRDYRVKRVVLQQMGMEILIERVTAEAIAGLELDPNFDVIRGSMIACEGYPKNPSLVDEVEFKLDFTRPIESSASLNGPNQKVLSAKGNVVTLVVSRHVLNKERATAEQQDVYLRSDRHVQSDHPDIRAVADSIASSLPVSISAGGAESFVREASGWVNAYIRKKGFGQGFASAVDVMRTREGDCTEHAVLLTALLRAAGVPARTAVGLVYSGGSLVGHMWAEAYVDYWRSVDALDPDNNPVRIRVAVSSDERALDETDVANAYSFVGGVKVHVQDFRPRDRE